MVKLSEKDKPWLELKFINGYALGLIFVLLVTVWECLLKNIWEIIK